MAYQSNVKKQALLAEKEKILRNIKYFEHRIEEARSQKTNACYFDDDDDDSDSEITFLDMGPSVSDLKLEQRRLQICLNATQELTNLFILQSEVNILVNDPVYEREPPVTEEGIWREVTADCRVDLVPFSITFYTHQPSRPYGPIAYRGLRVLPVKAAHENELSKSILPRVDNPSDAVEVLRNYAIAHRSRRTSLARLAEKYSNSLFMEPLVDGGYIIKCANLLEVRWTLENTLSSIAAFQHRMKFDLEYMDEAYVKIISQAHRELSDPLLETDERTRLMSKIIATCLEARGPTLEPYESMESDIDSENMRKRNTSLDEDIEEPVNKKKKDSEIMAPPKSIPKKTKRKGKENNVVNEAKPDKRPVLDDREVVAKKAKVERELAQHNLVKNSNVEIISNNTEKDVATLKNVTNKANKIKDKIDSNTNMNKDGRNIMSNKGKSDANTKRSNKDNVVKNVDANTKQRSHKENIVTLEPVSHNTDGNVVNDGFNPEAKKNEKAKLKNVTESTKNKNTGTQNLKRKSSKQKNIGDTERNKLVNIIKATELRDMPNSDVRREKGNNNDDEVNTMPQNIQNKNSVGSMKIISTKADNGESSSQSNNEKTSKTNVNIRQIDIGNKDKLLNKVKAPNNKVHTNAKSTGNVKKHDAIKDNANKDDNTTKDIPKAKVVAKSKIENPVVSNSGDLNIQKKFASTNNEKNLKSKSKESLNDKVSKAQPYISKKKEHEERTKEKNVNKKICEKDPTKYFVKEHSTMSKLKQKNAETNLDLAKPRNICDDDDREFRHSKPDKKVKVPVKDINTKSNNKDKAADKNDKQNIVTGKIDKQNIETQNSDKQHILTGKNNKQNMVTAKNAKQNIITEKNDKQNIVTDKNVKQNTNPARVNAKTLTDLNKNNDDINKNTDCNVLKQKNNNNKQISHANNNNVRKKLPNPNLNTKNAPNVKNIANKNVRTSKSPKHIDKIELLNPRNKMSIDKLKVKKNKQVGNDLIKKNNDKNKIYTKIPQKIMSIQKHMVKKNPLRISPRKNNSVMKTDSQNTSKSSQISLQKPMTGVPRLMKKPIRKE